MEKLLKGGERTKNGAVIRADFGTITVGDKTAVEEGVIIHEAERVSIGVAYGVTSCIVNKMIGPDRVFL